MASIIRQKNIVEEGDVVIIYINFKQTFAVVAERGKVVQTKYGAVRHENLIGRSYGTRVACTKGYVYILCPTPELWMQNLPHRTQILYTSDVALVTFNLDLKPGSVVGEAGTGSGAVSHAVVRTVAPNGHLHTYEINEPRFEAAKKEFERHGLADLVTIRLRDVCSEDGFDLEGVLDAVFLDLPKPWDALLSAKRALKPDRACRICSFSPCIEQTQKTCEELRKLGFTDVDVVECVSRSLKVVEVDRTNGTILQKNKEKIQGPPPAKIAKFDEKSAEEQTSTTLVHVSFPIQQPTHTGYLTFATLPPRPKD